VCVVPSPFLHVLGEFLVVKLLISSQAEDPNVTAFGLLKALQ